jgi:hypothetical protein
MGHDWMKAHLMCGITTNIFSAVEITGRYGTDYPQFSSLVERAARHFPVYAVRGARVAPRPARPRDQHLLRVLDTRSQVQPR